MNRIKKTLLCLIAVAILTSCSICQIFAANDTDILGDTNSYSDSDYSIDVSDDDFQDGDKYGDDFSNDTDNKDNKSTDSQKKYRGKTPADVQSLNLTVGIDKSLKLPLSLNRDTDQFYLLGNMNPGDTLRGSVLIKNDSSEPAQVALSEVVKNAGMTPGLDQYVNVSLALGEDVIYTGTMEDLIRASETKTDSAITLTPWLTVEPGAEITLNITCEVSRDLDNEYQGAVLDTNWIFDARADVPEDPEEIDETKPGKDYYEVIEINNDDAVTTGQRIVGIIAASSVVVLAIVGIVLTAKKKKKK